MWGAEDPQVIEQAHVWGLTPDMVATAWNWNQAASNTVGWTPPDKQEER